MHPFEVLVLIVVQRILIKNSFSSFLQKHPFQYLHYHRFQFGFVGSVAFYFKSYISEIMHQKNIDCIFLEKPIKNLLNFYQK